MVKLSKKDRILEYMYSAGTASKKDIIEGTGISYYHNTSKHVGDMLSRLVNNGTLARIKRGIYGINDTEDSVVSSESKEQMIITFDKKEK